MTESFQQLLSYICKSRMYQASAAILVSDWGISPMGGPPAGRSPSMYFYLSMGDWRFAVVQYVAIAKNNGPTYTKRPTLGWQ